MFHRQSALSVVLFFIWSLCASTSALANPVQSESICGVDERRVGRFGPVGVVRKLRGTEESSFCTITLVSDSCAVSAGHCLHVLEEAEFFGTSNDERLSIEKYSVAPGSVRALQTRIGNDWAVARLMPHKSTGLLPGKVHGFVDVELNAQSDTPIGVYTFSPRKALSKQIEIVRAEGDLLWTQGSILFHDLDTDRGSSGSLIFDALTDRAVAIHTHGGCDTMKNNKATYISQVPYLVKAIEMCRAEEMSFD